MKINNKILSIPPYISTAWKNIALLNVEARQGHLVLIVSLNNGSTIEIPNLANSAIEAVFAAHVKFIEQESAVVQTKNPARLPNDTSAAEFGPPIKIGPAGIEGLDTAFQHNPEQMNAPEIPPEILDKVVAISKAIGISDSNLLPQAEPHCNCPHCQIARAIHTTLNGAEAVAQQLPAEEEVSDDDLKFRVWDISQTADKLYQVTNPLDGLEQYHVFLGDSIGCTCGHKNCEHIRAVLSS